MPKGATDTPAPRPSRLRRAWAPVAQAGRRTGQAVRRAFAPARGVYRRVRTPAQSIDPARLEAGVSARRPLATALALLAFIAGFSVDDLRVLRLPAYLVGAGVALLLLVVGPLAMGRGLALKHLEETIPDFESRADRTRRIAYLALLGVALVLVGWLVVYSAGVPPWAR